MKNITLGLLIICFFSTVKAQELNSKVQILAPNLSNISRKNLDLLQNTIKDFLNNNKWTSESYLPQEKIETNLVITISNWDGNSAYTAEAQIQSSRPIYNSSYNSTLLNISDKDFSFNYNDGQPLDFSDQNFITNLSSLLGFYAYTIIGLDKDSFGKMAGTPYFIKAQNVVNVAQTTSYKGWKAVDGLRNRYWINENLLNNSFKELRSFIYDYHVNGLDKMQENPTLGITNIVSALPSLQQMDKKKLGAVFVNAYFANKAEELTNVLAMSQATERLKAYALLGEIDPANVKMYELLKRIKN